MDAVPAHSRDQAVFHNIVNEIKNEMFDDAADVILGRLAEAAEAVGKALGEALQALAEKVSFMSSLVFCTLNTLRRLKSVSPFSGRAPRITPNKCEPAQRSSLSFSKS